MLLTKGNVWGGTVEQELSDAQWKLIQPWLPAPKRRGRPRADDRRTINGVLYVLRTGCRWQDLPGEYGSSVTCWRRLNQWQEQGVWEDIWRTLLGTLDAQGRLEWERATWMPLSPQPKRGRPGRTDPQGQGHQTDAGGRQPGNPSGSLGGQRPAGGDHSGRGYLGNGEGTAGPGTTPQSSRGTGSRPRLRFSSIPKPVAAEGNQALHPGTTWKKAATRQESSGVQLPPSVGSRTDLRLVAQLSSAGSSIREKSASLFRLRPAGLFNPAH